MNRKERFSSAKGTVTYAIIKDGEVIERKTINNLIVTVGKGQMAHLLGNDVVGNAPVNIAAGTNGTATTLADTTITGAVPVALGATTFPAVGSVNWAWTFGTGDANGITIQELGLICGDGNLFSRLVIPPIAKTSAISVIGNWQIDF